MKPQYQWPVGIVVVLLVVIGVNLAVAWYAVGHPPQIEASYELITR